MFKGKPGSRSWGLWVNQEKGAGTEAALSERSDRGTHLRSGTIHKLEGQPPCCLPWKRRFCPKRAGQSLPLQKTYWMQNRTGNLHRITDALMVRGGEVGG